MNPFRWLRRQWDISRAWKVTERYAISMEIHTRVLCFGSSGDYDGILRFETNSITGKKKAVWEAIGMEFCKILDYGWAEHAVRNKQPMGAK
jgi:hypothetical protein